MTDRYQIRRDLEEALESVSDSLTLDDVEFEALLADILAEMNN